MNCKNCGKKLKNYTKMKKVIFTNIQQGTQGTQEFCSKSCKREYIATLRKRKNIGKVLRKS